MLFDRVAIIGVGLIGGSLALAGRRAGLIGEVVGVGRGAANLTDARELGIVDRTTSDLTAIGAVDLVVIAVPVRSTAEIARTLAPHLAPGTVVTDVGSVKESVVAGDCGGAAGELSVRRRAPDRRQRADRGAAQPEPISSRARSAS